MIHKTLILLITTALALTACPTPATLAPTDLPTLVASTATPLATSSPTSVPEATLSPVYPTPAQLAANCNPACESSLWMINVDGQNLTKLADGNFIAFVNDW